MASGAAQKPIELILARQLATHLAMPIFLVDADGTLVFFNEPAERILGRRFDETGEMPAAAWSPTSPPRASSAVASTRPVRCRPPTGPAASGRPTTAGSGSRRTRFR